MNGRADDDAPTGNQTGHRDVIADFLDNDQPGGNDADGGAEPNGDQGEPNGDTPAGDGEKEPGEGEQQGEDNAPAQNRIHLPGADPARGWVSWLANRPTPGGIFLMIGAILFFIFALVPMNADGDTRLFLIWRSLTGGARVPADTTTAQAEQSQKAQAEAAWQGFWTGAVAVITDELS